MATYSRLTMLLYAILLVLAVIGIHNSSANAGTDSSMGATRTIMYVDDSENEAFSKIMHGEYHGLIDSEFVSTCYTMDCLRVQIIKHSNIVDDRRRLIIVPVPGTFESGSHETKAAGDNALSSIAWLSHILYHARSGPQFVLCMMQESFPLQNIIAESKIDFPKSTILVAVQGHNDLVLDPSHTRLPRLTLGDHYSTKGYRLDIINPNHETIDSEIKFPVGLPKYHLLQRFKLQVASIRACKRETNIFFSGRVADKNSNALSDDHQAIFKLAFDDLLSGMVDVISDDEKHRYTTPSEKIVYFFRMSRSIFSLCPMPWQSYRLYETLELGSIPLMSRKSFTPSSSSMSFYPAIRSVAEGETSLDGYPGPLFDDIYDNMPVFMLYLDYSKHDSKEKVLERCNDLSDGDFESSLAIFRQFNVNISFDKDVCKSLKSNPEYYDNLFEVLVDIIQNRVTMWYKRKKIEVNQYLLQALADIPS